MVDFFAAKLGQEWGVEREDKVVIYGPSNSDLAGGWCRAYSILKFLGVKDTHVLYGGIKVRLVSIDWIQIRIHNLIS